MQKLISFKPAFDRRSSPKNYGIRSAVLEMILLHNNRAVSFTVLTGWNLEHIQDEFDKRNDHILCHPRPIDLGYHSPIRMADYQTLIPECGLIKGFCYYDSSGLNAITMYKVLIEGGSEAVWTQLKILYHDYFGEVNHEKTNVKRITTDTDTCPCCKKRLEEKEL